jgi:hypothetical protein
MSGVLYRKQVSRLKCGSESAVQEIEPAWPIVTGEVPLPYQLSWARLRRIMGLIPPLARILMM